MNNKHILSDVDASGVTVRYDLSAALTDAAIRKKLVDMGWTPPGAAPTIRNSLTVGDSVIRNPRMAGDGEPGAAPQGDQTGPYEEYEDSDGDMWARPVQVAQDNELSGNSGELNSAARAVLTERRRQIEDEGWTPEHDDEHASDEIAALACFYAMPPAARDWDASSTGYGPTLGEAILPVDWHAISGDRRRELIKAGALILAEIERLDRAQRAGKGE